MYHIIISPRAKRELKNVAKRYRKAFVETIEELKDNPFIGKPLTRELTGRYSYRIGIYRIIYKISNRDKRVYIITAGHRAMVYE